MTGSSRIALSTEENDSGEVTAGAELTLLARKRYEPLELTRVATHTKKLVF